MRHAAHRLAFLTVIAFGGAFVLAYDEAERSLSGSVPPGQQILEEAPHPAEARPVSLRDAWDIAVAEASRRYEEPVVLSLVSADAAGDSAAETGFDGKRRYWEASVTSLESSDSRLHIRVLDGAVVEVTQELLGADRSSFLRSPPAIDSPQAARQALEHSDLAGAAEKASGLHFGYFFDPDARAPVVRIIGTIGGQPGAVDFDAGTGEAVAVWTQSIERSGGMLVSADGGKTWKSSDLVGRFVRAITTVPGVERSGFVLTVDDEGVQLHRTDDGGLTWRAIAPLPDEAGTWVFDLQAVRLGDDAGLSLLAGTPSGLWVSTDEGYSWVRDVNVPAGPVWQIEATHSDQNSRVFVSIVPDPGGAALFASDDMVRWTNEGTGAFRLSSTAAGDAVVAIDENRDVGAMLIRPNRAAEIIELPKVGEGAARVGKALILGGSPQPGSPLLAQSPGGIQLSLDGGRTWRTTLEANLASLGVRGYQAGGGLVVAGGFREGIYYSDDGGQTWVETLPNPSSLVPGSNEITSVVFLSPSHVVAANSSTIGWKREPALRSSVHRKAG